MSYVSQLHDAEPGDVITTGTPPGVGLGMKPPMFLKKGDVMTLGIEGLGEQRQDGGAVQGGRVAPIRIAAVPGRCGVRLRAHPDLHASRIQHRSRRTRCACASPNARTTGCHKLAYAGKACGAKLVCGQSEPHTMRSPKHSATRRTSGCSAP